MRVILISITVLFVFMAPAAGFTDEEKSAKEGIAEVHDGMLKVLKAVDKNAKKGWKRIDKKAKKGWKAADKKAKTTWKKAGQDMQKKTED